MTLTLTAAQRLAMESSRPSAAPLTDESRPVETSYVTTRSAVLSGSVPQIGVMTSLKERLVRDRATFFGQASVPVPLGGSGFNFFTDRQAADEGSLDERIVVRPVVRDTYAAKGGGDISISTPVDFNPDNDGIDRKIQVPAVAVQTQIVKPSQPKDGRRVTFSPFRMTIWTQNAGQSFNDAVADLQGAVDKQIPKGKYVFTFRMTPDPAGEYIAYTDGFTFDVNGKVQTLDKAVYDPQTGVVRIQVTVRENLVWLIPLGIAAAGALGYMFSQADDVLMQVDRILVDSWIPVVAAGGALALYFIWKNRRV